MEVASDPSSVVQAIPIQSPQAPMRRGGATTIACTFTLTALLASALLFAIEPFFARLLLPRLGGSPAVWNTCLVFFQLCLLAGYAYAHLLARLLKLRSQMLVHCVLVASAIALLPPRIPASWVPPPQSAQPVWWVLGLLTMTIGLPFFALSATGPLLQSWFARSGHPRASNPYFLYSAGNLGSMVALLSYPTLIEPRLALSTQARAWQAGFIAFVFLLTACAALLAMRRGAVEVLPSGTREREATAPSEDRAIVARWLVLAFVPSSYLLGVTTHITSDLAAVPLFWVVPLALYLSSFILVFAPRPPVPHSLMVSMLPGCVMAVLLVWLAGISEPKWLVIGVHLLALWAVSMVCHGELARTRPAANRLTRFYLVMSVGGALGGMFNALLAPLIFRTTVEYPVVIALACAVMPRRAPPARGVWTRVVGCVIAAGFMLVVMRGLLTFVEARSLEVAATMGLAILPLSMCFIARRRPLLLACFVGGALLALGLHARARDDLLVARRGFFGVHRVVRNPTGPFNDLYHGSTLHGRQHMDNATGGPTRPREPLTYYHREGPVGQLVEVLRSRPARDEVAAGLHDVALVGLGVGSLAGYADSGMRFTYYEIDPLVRALADDTAHFTFLSEARGRGADVNVILGDARLRLVDALDGGADLLVLDAFSGDAIPVHLLTREAMHLYARKVSSHGGVIALHLSNQFLDLRPLVANLAADAGWMCLLRDDVGVSPEEARATGREGSTWVVLVRDLADVGPLARDPRWRWLGPQPGAPLWTDDYSDVISVFR